MTDSLSETYSDISCTSLGVNFALCMQFTGEVTSVVVEINMLGLYLTMIGILRQLSEPRLRQQGGIEKSQTPVERDIFVQWVRNAWHILVCHHSFSFCYSRIFRLD